jgi:hypothetical protein
MNLVVASPLRNDFASLVYSFSETDRVMLSVKDGVIELHEGVTEDEHILVVVSVDGKRHHRDTALLRCGLILGPVVGGEIEVLTVNNKSHLGLSEFSSFLASPVTTEVCLFLVLEICHGPGGEGHKGSSRVRGHSALFGLAEAETLSVNLDILQGNGEKDGVDNLMPREGVLHEAVRVVEAEGDLRGLFLGAEG